MIKITVRGNNRRGKNIRVSIGLVVLVYLAVVLGIENELKAINSKPQQSVWCRLIICIVYLCSIINLYSLFLITLVVFEMYKNCLFYSTNKLVVFVRRGIALYWLSGSCRTLISCVCKNNFIRETN